jgi:hypothetical protein
MIVGTAFTKTPGLSGQHLRSARIFSGHFLNDGKGRALTQPFPLRPTGDLECVHLKTLCRTRPSMPMALPSLVAPPHG